MAVIKALTQKEVKEFQRRGRQDHSEAMVIAKFFLPIAGHYWYLTELDTDPTSEEYGIGFGFANLNDPQCAELGYIDLFELLQLNRHRKLDRSVDQLTDIKIGGPEACIGVVERDIHWSPRPVSEIIEKVKSSGWA